MAVAQGDGAREGAVVDGEGAAVGDTALDVAPVSHATITRTESLVGVRVD